jgi:hypothetical protein
MTKECKRYILTLAALAIMLSGFFMPFVTKASVITDAQYIGDLEITNNSTATSIVSTNFTLDSAALIASSLANTSFNNTAIRTNAGADTAYMPSANTSYPWCVYVPSIGNETLTYKFYAGGATDMVSSIRYFPGTTGATTSDNTSLEYSGNFTEEKKGYFDTSASAVGANITLKQDAFKVWVSGTGNVSAGIGANTGNYTQLLAATVALQIDSAAFTRGGERFTSLPVCQINSVQFNLLRVGAATGTANITVRRASDDVIIGLLGTQDVSLIGLASANYTYSNPVINPAAQDIRIQFEYSGGTGVIRVELNGDNTNPYAGGTLTRYNAGYTDVAGEDARFNLSISPISVTAPVTSGEHTISVSTNQTYTTGSMTFYPDAHVETTSVDGYVMHANAAGITWAALQGAVGSAAGSSDASNWFLVQAHGINANRWVDLRRFIYLTDITGLPAGVTVTSSIFSINGFGKTDTGGWLPDLNIYSSAPASNTNLDAGDFDSLGTTPFCATLVTYNGFNITGYNNFTLNGDGITALNTAYAGDKILKLGLRNANYDVAIIEPAWVASAYWIFKIYNSEQGAGFKPKLVVNYTTAPVTNLNLYVDGVLASTTVITGVTVPDNANPWVDGGMTYIEYVKRWVGGVLQQYYYWEYGTTFSDHSGAATLHPATPSFRTTSSDADVSARLTSFTPIETASASSVSANETTMISSAPAQPAGMYTIGGPNPTWFIAPMINTLLDAFSIPRQIFWYPFMMGLCFGFGWLSYKLTKSIFIKAVIVGMIIFFGWVSGVYGGWIMIFYCGEAFGILVLAKNYGW